MRRTTYDDLTKVEQRRVDKAVKHGVNRRQAVNCMAAARKYRYVTFPLMLALTEQESGAAGGRNVFGHDRDSHGHLIFPAKPGTVMVTHALYTEYLRRRGPSGRGGMQGVGPCQLTWWATQDLADERGGCHLPYVNIDVAAQILGANIKAFGYVVGIQRYNGVGPAAVAYSVSVRAKARAWRQLLR